MAERIRITGGSVLNKRLSSPPKESIRPASDLLRQVVFNLLGSQIENAVFYDVFAGVGVVGIEAVSRGADRAIFVELERQYIQLIRKNIEHVGFGAQTAVRTGDAFVWGKHFIPDHGKVIVFLGPPYPLFQSKPNEFAELIGRVQQKLDDDDWLILQFPRRPTPPRCRTPNTGSACVVTARPWIGVWRKNGEPGSPIWTMPDEPESDAAVEIDEADDLETESDEPAHGG